MRTSGTSLVDDLLQSGTTTSATLTIGTYHHILMVMDVSNTDRFFILMVFLLVVF
jgi:hypothetical protein